MSVVSSISRRSAERAEAVRRFALANRWCISLRSLRLFVTPHFPFRCWELGDMGVPPRKASGSRFPLYSSLVPRCGVPLQSLTRIRPTRTYSSERSSYTMGPGSLERKIGIGPNPRAFNCHVTSYPSPRPSTILIASCSLLASTSSLMLITPFVLLNVILPLTVYFFILLVFISTIVTFCGRGPVERFGEVYPCVNGYTVRHSRMFHPRPIWPSRFSVRRVAPSHSPAIFQ